MRCLVGEEGSLEVGVSAEIEDKLLVMSVSATCVCVCSYMCVYGVCVLG